MVCDAKRQQAWVVPPFGPLDILWIVTRRWIDTRVRGNMPRGWRFVGATIMVVSGIRVGVADTNTMDEVAEGELPFDRLPPNAKQVNLFPRMHSPLIGCGKRVTNDCIVVLGSVQAAVVTGTTQRTI